MNKIRYLLTSIGFFVFQTASIAGSYDDFFRYIGFDQASAVQHLLDRGFDPNTVNPEGVPALLKALQEQSFKTAKVLIEDARTQVNVRNLRDESPLMLAALRGQESLVIALVAKGADVNQPGWTPLHYAATGGHLRIAAFLMGVHANVDARSPNGTTPLMMAAMYSNSAMVKLLLESGAAADLRNAQGLTAEDFANQVGRTDSVQLIRQVLAR